jgi:hypothetical protein
MYNSFLISLIWHITWGQFHQTYSTKCKCDSSHSFLPTKIWPTLPTHTHQENIHKLYFLFNMPVNLLAQKLPVVLLCNYKIIKLTPSLLRFKILQTLRVGKFLNSWEQLRTVEPFKISFFSFSYIQKVNLDHCWTLYYYWKTLHCHSGIFHYWNNL